MTEENTGPKKDPVADFKQMPNAEKLLAAAAAAVLLALILIGGWKYMFKRGWTYPCAVIGSIGTIVLVGLHLAKVKLMDASMRIKVVAGLALLPILGYVIDKLSNFQSALFFAGIVAMALAGIKITSRENLIKRD